MANLIIAYWRAIPFAISVKAGRKEEKRMLADRFQEAIDMAAMRGGASDTDSYLAGWRRAGPFRWETISRRKWKNPTPISKTPMIKTSSKPSSPMAGKPENI